MNQTCDITYIHAHSLSFNLPTYLELIHIRWFLNGREPLEIAALGFYMPDPIPNYHPTASTHRRILRLPVVRYSKKCYWCKWIRNRHWQWPEMLQQSRIIWSPGTEITKNNNNPTIMTIIIIIITFSSTPDVAHGPDFADPLLYNIWLLGCL